MKRLAVVLVVIMAMVACTDGALLIAIQKRRAWDAGATYDAGKYCQETGTVYCSLADGNRGNEPSVSPAWWAEE